MALVQRFDECQAFFSLSCFRKENNFKIENFFLKCEFYKMHLFSRKIIFYGIFEKFSISTTEN